MKRNAVFFLGGPAMAALAVCLLFAMAPWPLPHPSQAVGLSWLVTIPYLLAGAIGAAISTRIGCPQPPRLTDRPGCVRLVLWATAAGLAYGAIDLALMEFTPWGAEVEARDRASGYTWANVGLPWSLLHYLHGAVLLEAAYRLAALAIPVWLISNVLLRGRFQAAVFWLVAVAVALVEPLQKAILLRKIPLLGMSPMEALVTAEAVVAQLVFAWMLRRYGWAAPIVMRYAYYLLVRVFVGYLYPPTSIMYPGPH